MINKQIITIEGVTYDLKDVLFVFALQSESGDYFNEFNVCYTGIGKVRATYFLLESINKYSPKLIINLGSVGSNVFKKGEMVCCTKFIQRDMNLEGLGFKKYETPFTTDNTIILKNGLKFNHLPTATCGTGDQFETALNSNDYEVVDMEAFAIAWTALQKNIPFLCIKYITDGADSDASKDWKKEVISSGSLFKNLFL